MINWEVFLLPLERPDQNWGYAEGRGWGGKKEAEVSNSQPALVLRVLSVRFLIQTFRTWR